MTKFERKVILLIVEGNSEESLLIERLRELFKQHSIRFRIFGGDILYDAKRRKKSIKAIIGDTIKEYAAKSKFKMNDIFAVLHIIDTDGCLIPKEDVVVKKGQEKLTVYTDENIQVSSDNQRNRIVERNEARSQNINVMRTMETILPSHLHYRMYYFSRNIEHVLFDEPNPEQTTKVMAIENFIESLDVPIEEYLAQYMHGVDGEDVAARYTESWMHVLESTGSLQRATNVPLLFEFVRANMDVG